MTDYEKLMEKVLQHFAGNDFKEELLSAKKSFFGNLGLLEEKSDQFEARMAQFYDWYFFTRQLTGFGLTPLNACHMIRSLRFSDDEKLMLEKLKNSHHSLFQLSKVKGEDIHIKDLFSGNKMVVERSPWIYGFDSLEFFEARLIPKGETYFFTKGFCFHPESASKYILAEIKHHKKDPDLNPEDFMLKLVKMRYKFEQYRHLQPEMIYSNDSKVMAR